MRFPPAGATAALLAVAGALSLSAAPPPASRALTPLERRGRQIYLTGTSPSGRPVTASLGGSPMPVPASVLPCSNCHGFDGRGRPEGGVVPPDITWEALTKPYGRTGADGRKTPPYNEAALSKAITAGEDPAGKDLSPAMPKYALDPGDLAALVSFVRRLGSGPDPGVTPTEIAIGGVVSPSGPAAEASRAARDVLQAYFADVNEKGGIYGRRLKLNAIDAAAGPQTASEDVLAVVGAVAGGSGSDLVSFFDEGGIPYLDTANPFPPEGAVPSRYAFFLFSGVSVQARVLVDFAAESRRVPGRSLAIVSAPDAVPSAVVDAVEAQCRKAGVSPAVRISFGGAAGAAEIARRLKEAAAGGVVLLAAPGAGEELMREAAGLGFTPDFYLPGSLAGRGVLGAPPALEDRVFIAYPVWPPDSDSPGVRELLAFLSRHGQAPTHLVAQLSAYAAAKVLVEGLQRAGRGVSREKLVDVLEGLYDLETGVTPPMTFGPNRRIGVEGASVGVVDLGARTLRRVGGQTVPR